MRITVRLTPRSGADAIDGVVDGVLRARVTAAPVDGAANRALERLLARELGVAPSRCRVVAGASARIKVVELDGADATRIAAQWPELGV